MTTTPAEHIGSGPAEHELLTIIEVADLLRVPPATLRYWRNQSTGPRSFRIGRHVRYYRADLDKWLRDQRGTDGPPAT